MKSLRKDIYNPSYEKWPVTVSGFVKNNLVFRIHKKRNRDGRTVPFFETLFALVHIFDQTLDIFFVLGNDVKFFDVTIGKHGCHGEILGQFGF